MITSVLAANRGEIARRVFATCRALGVRTAAVYSDADADSPHVAEADAAVRLHGDAAAATYLRGDLIIAAAHAAGADAIHPGYGFLSENADFAQDVRDAGLIWIGPPPEAIRSMGSKTSAKKLMDAAGVPVLTQLDPDTITAADLPVLIKASAGGGGRGMRVVRDIDGLSSELAAAAREAESAFGDPEVFCERYLETGHHIEVQVLADQHGTVWAVGERECSIQRRHQKVIEEAPSPLVERIPGMRERLFAAARAAASAIDYEGAGTVEFLADDAGGFYFLEMNTRLQVEHPVTEATTGLDLVALQLDIANGASLPPEPPPLQGHSIEARLYAEDPAHDWRPQSGALTRFTVPSATTEFGALAGPGIRLDSGVTDGSVISVHYDPMLAKVISWAPTRAQAALLLSNALRRAVIHGPGTNRDLLVRVLEHPAFRAGETDTAFFAVHDLAKLSEPLANPVAVELSALAAALADAAANQAAAPVNGGLPSGWRNVVSGPQHKTFGDVEVRYRITREGLVSESHPDVTLLSATPDRVVLAAGGVRRNFMVARHGAEVFVDSPLGPVTLSAPPRFVTPGEAVAAGSLLAPLPGAVTRIGVQAGDTVTAGQPVLWLEAMKMEHTIAAPADGTVSELPVAVGQQVAVGDVLAVLTGEDRSAE